MKRISILEILRFLIEHVPNKNEARSLGKIIIDGQEGGEKEKNNVTMVSITPKQKEKIKILAKKTRRLFLKYAEL
jgi:hypothetical protein